MLTFIVFNLIHAHQIHPIPYLRAICLGRVDGFDQDEAADECEE